MPEVEAVERIITDSQSVFEQSLAEVYYAAFLGGGLSSIEHPAVASFLRAAVARPALPPPPSQLQALGVKQSIVRYPVADEAAAKLSKAHVMTPEDFYSLGAKARGNAFTITADLTTQTISNIRDLAAENMAKGADREKFMADVAKMFGPEGGPMSEAHTEQVFRNAVNSAYSDGGSAMLQAPIVRDAFPYRMYFATTDRRVRPEHLHLERCGLNGTAIYRADDRVWLTLRPPWSWNCRCSWAPITVEQAARLGVKEAQDWLERAKQTGKQLWEVPPAIAELVVWPTWEGHKIEPPASWVRT